MADTNPMDVGRGVYELETRGRPYLHFRHHGMKAG